MRKSCMLTPPARQVIQAEGLITVFVDASAVLTAGAILDQVASTYRYRRSLVAAVKQDVLRFAAMKFHPITVGIWCAGTDRRFATFFFDRALVDEWLEAGGRPWIIAELERRNSGKVVAFPARKETWS